ncbi:uncharacterized protein [Amphiura filiformis]|uniref:uncharacterized protein n=1 Tax=Amphiura filiformis TaxID=82378 RepID=UPI003B20F08F
MAAYHNHTETCKLLLENNANVNSKRNDGSTALHLGVSCNHIDICKLLLENNANVNYSESTSGFTALHAAAYHNHTDICKLLLENNANVNSVTNIGATALYWAAYRNNIDTCELLLENNANVNTESSDGSTPLHRAAAKNHTDTCKLLLENNANVNSKTNAGYTPLHSAVLNGHTGSCEILLKYNANVNAQAKGGNTALHLAAQRIYIVNAITQDGNTQVLHFSARQQYFINLCILLIENGADVSTTNSKGDKPIFMLPISDKNVYDLVHKAMERAKYKDLMETGATPVEVVKLFVCGAPSAGKTTLKHSLTQDLQENKKESDNDLPQEFPYNPTAGIDIDKSAIEGVGVFRIWDLAGHVEYHISHAMFLGAENSIFIVVYNLVKELHKQDLRYWLCFFKSGHLVTRPTKPRVVIVSSHMDQVKDKKAGGFVAKRNLKEMRLLFKESLDIVDCVLTVNACNATDEGFEILKETLKHMAADILGTRMLPAICQNILDQGHRWYTPHYPVLPWSFFFDRVKEIAAKQIKNIESMIDGDIVQATATYLHEMGEIYLAKEQDEDSESLVIMNIQWLCSNVIAKVLAGDEFPAEFQKLPDKPVYTEEELRDFLEAEEGLGFELTVMLLEHLKILFTTDDGNYLIPSKLPPSLPPILIDKSDNSQLYGIRVECADESDMFSPDFFPNILLHILGCHPESQGKTNYSNSAVKFVSPVEGMLQLTDMSRAINVAVVCENEADRTRVHSQLQSLQRSIQVYLRQRSPGTVVTWKFLSPKSLKTEYNLEKVLYYELNDLHKAEKGDGMVYHSQQAHKDDMTNVLCQGVDRMFITKFGGVCGWEWIPIELQKMICAVLDKPHPLRSDYRMIAEVLKVPDERLEQLIGFCLSSRGHSITAEILQEVCVTRRRNGDKLTIQEVVTLLKHPGIIGRDDLAKEIESMLLSMGHAVQDEITCELVVPADLLLWRAVLRRVHQDIKRKLKASQLTTYLVDDGRFLSEDDEDEIDTKEKHEGRRKAVDLLLCKLMQLKQLGWHERFLTGLQQEEPTLVPVVIEARDKLLQERWFASIPSVSVSQHQYVTDLLPKRPLDISDDVPGGKLVPRMQDVVKFNPEELLPYNMPAKNKLKLLDNFQLVLNRPSVRAKLISIITEDILDFFPDLPRLHKDEILQRFVKHGQHRGAEYFLDKLEIMGTSWPKNLMVALEAQKHYDHMQYLFEELQHLLQEREHRTEREDSMGVPPKSNKSADEIARDLQHLQIWEKVVNLKMGMLREIASEPIIHSLSLHMPDFLQMYKSEFAAKRSSDGETKAVRWILVRLQKSKDLRWPGALQDILKCNDALLNEVWREFWKIHDEGCICMDHLPEIAVATR